MNPEARGRTLELVAKRPAVRDELLERAHAGDVPGLARAGLSATDLERFFDGDEIEVGDLPEPETPGLSEVDFDLRIEAIVRDFDRPTILIVDDTWQPSDNPSMNAELEAARPKLEAVLGRVGRIEFRNVPMLWGGTGWVLEDRIIITNRHVGELVAQADGRGGFRFKPTLAGVPAEARIDFKSEHGSDEDDASEEVPLSAVRYLASSTRPDIALFQVAKGVALPRPVSLSTRKLKADAPVAVIGYPAFDSRSDRRAVDRYFGDIFEVKRMAPGIVTQVPGSDGIFFMHDATTLGGNSGSLVVDLATGKAVGLHFAGQYHVGNYAHTVTQINKALRGLRTMVTVPAGLASLTEKRDGAHAPSFFAGRAGYQPGFLGTGERRVPLPALGGSEADVAIATEPGGRKRPDLRYTHFSVKFSASRKVPRITACNIDGAKWKKIKRGDDQWFSDGRLPADVQLGERDYAHPDIDRGHMVRREDPNWGEPADVSKANFDTFHYTNAAPQHARLNQRTTHWLGLENYVLENARTHGLKISVFTGPILRDDDPVLETGVQVPEEFWKIIAFLTTPDRKLRTTGYVLSQGEFIEDITEGFTFGEYRTYQVPVSQIATKTGYDFAQLAAADALVAGGLESAVPNVPPVIPLDRLESMVL